MRVAVIHDWLTVYGGAERVLKEILTLLPNADLFSIVDFFPEDKRHHLLGKRARTSFIQKLPFAKKHYRTYFPLMPFAIEQFDLSAYDLVISSNSAVAKGVVIHPHQLHICYCNTPVRFAWDMQYEYLNQAQMNPIKGMFTRLFLHKMRMWDAVSAARVDHFIANSSFIACRISKTYRREATVLYPPVDTTFFIPADKRGDFYLTASRLVPYKRVDLLLEAFRLMPSRKLLIIGDGPDYQSLVKKCPRNATLLGHQDSRSLRSYLQRARAFVYAAKEDFGIAPIEAQACGTPVIAFRGGGVGETIRGLEENAPTGVFFEEQTPTSLRDAIELFEKEREKITSLNCRENAERFSPDQFRQGFQTFLKEIV